MKYSLTYILAAVITAGILLAGCSGSGGEETSNTSSSAQKETNGLSAFEQENGIGPVTEEISIGEIDMEKVEKGKELFKTKCSACHKIDSRYVGPQLGTVFEDRTPTYVMNMILNPEEMVKKHPQAKKLLAEFLSPMPNQNLSPEEARAVVEFLASEQIESTENQ